MTDLANILAASDDGGLPKVLVGIAFFVIWVVSGILSQISKQKEQQRRQRVRIEIQGGGVAPPPAPPTLKATIQRSPPMRLARPAQARPGETIAQKLKRNVAIAAGKLARSAPPPLPARPRIPATTSARAPEILTHSAPQPALRRATNATAATLHSWLRPATLRQQFILTEVLQPPLSLRDRNI